MNPAIQAALISSIAGLGSTAMGTFGRKKVKGIPTPTGQQLGQQQREFFDEFAPQTTQWERIGSTSPVGNVQSASVGAKSAEKQLEATMALQKQQHSLETTLRALDIMTQKSIADKRDKTQREGSPVIWLRENMNSSLKRADQDGAFTKLKAQLEDEGLKKTLWSYIDGIGFSKIRDRKLKNQLYTNDVLDGKYSNKGKEKNENRKIDVRMDNKWQYPKKRW